MNEVPFRNLASAREEYAKLIEELGAVKEVAARTEALEAENSDLKVQLENAQKSLGKITDQLASGAALLSAKDEEIKILSADVSVLNVRCADLEKNAKSVKAQARELVAASAGPPAPVDNSEMEMTENDLIRAMAAETDTKKLNALYRQLKAQRAAK